MAQVFTFPPLNGSITSVNASIGANGAPAPASSTQVAGQNAGNLVPLALDISGNLAALPLPSGAATGAKQDTGNTSLGSIDTKLTSQATAAKQDTGNTSLAAIDATLSAGVKAAGKLAVDKARHDYTVNVTTAAYVELITSTAGAASEIEIFDSSGQTLVLAFGGAGAEVDKIYITPGGNGRIPLAVPASTRVSIKAVSATANAGELDINLYG